MSISVIIPTAHRAGSLALTLQTLCRQSTKAGDFEVLVVDNGAGESTLSAVEAAAGNHPHHNLIYIKERTPGLLAGRHRGALEAKSEFLAFIDDDVDVAPGWLSSIIQGFKDSNVHLVGGRSLPRYETEPPRWLEAFWGATPYGGRMCLYLSLLDLGDVPTIIDANYIWGLNLAIRRDTLFKLGGFHPDCIPSHLQRFQGDGETGLTARANELAFAALYQPGAIVWHRISAGRLTAKYLRQRAFYEGVALSYSTIRRAGGVGEETWQKRMALAEAFSGLDPAMRTREFWDLIWLRMRLVEWSPGGLDKRVSLIREVIRRAFVDGFEFHHKQVLNDPKLLTWVLREHYWDYSMNSFPALRESS